MSSWFHLKLCWGTSHYDKNNGCVHLFFKTINFDEGYHDKKNKTKTKTKLFSFGKVKTGILLITRVPNLQQNKVESIYTFPFFKKKIDKIRAVTFHKIQCTNTLLPVYLIVTMETDLVNIWKVPLNSEVFVDEVLFRAWNWSSVRFTRAPKAEVFDKNPTAPKVVFQEGDALGKCSKNA